MLTCAHDDVAHVYFVTGTEQDSRTIDWVDSLGKYIVPVFEYPLCNTVPPEVYKYAAASPNSPPFRPP